MDKLDSDLLRTFLAIADTGSVTDGAARIYRSQSAASLQIKRLEETLGQTVFDRHGRGVTLTAAGERLQSVARDITERLDQTLRTLRADDIAGSLRIGIPDDHSPRILTRLIAEFTQAHPLVELGVTCDLSANFPKALASGALDLAVYEVEVPDNPDAILWQDQTHWVGARHHDLLTRDVLPIALFDRDCWWRDAALSTLDQLKRPYRVVFSSQSVTGVVAAIEAGVAIGLLGESALNDRLTILPPEQGFPVMPVSNLVLGCSRSAESPARKSMTAAIRHAFTTQAP